MARRKAPRIPDALPSRGAADGERPCGVPVDPGKHTCRQTSGMTSLSFAVVIVARTGTVTQRGDFRGEKFHLP